MTQYVTTDLIEPAQGAISGERNRVINGSMQIVNVASVAVPSANNVQVYGGPEMFLAQNQNAGGQFTQSQQSLSFGGLTLPTVRQTVNTANTNITAGNYWYGIYQRLEGFNSFDLRGKPVSISFVFNTNVSGTYSVALRDDNGNGAGNNSYVTTITAVANTPLLVTLPILAIPSGATIPNTNAIGLHISVGTLNTGVFQTATLNAWQSGNFGSAAGATNWGATAGNFIELTNLQLEEGPIATPFIRRSYGVELALTQRYYHADIATLSAYSLAGNVFQYRHRFPGTMRAVPTFTSSFTFSNSSTGQVLNITSDSALHSAIVTSTGSASFTNTYAASARL